MFLWVIFLEEFKQFYSAYTVVLCINVAQSLSTVYNYLDFSFIFSLRRIQIYDNTWFYIFLKYSLQYANAYSIFPYLGSFRKWIENQTGFKYLLEQQTANEFYGHLSTILMISIKYEENLTRPRELLTFKRDPLYPDVSDSHCF